MPEEQEALERKLFLVGLAQADAAVELDAELGVSVETAEAVADRHGVREFVARAIDVGKLRVFADRHARVESDPHAAQKAMIEHGFGHELDHARAAREVAGVRGSPHFADQREAHALAVVEQLQLGNDAQIPEAAEGRIEVAALQSVQRQTDADGERPRQRVRSDQIETEASARPASDAHVARVVDDHQWPVRVVGEQAELERILRRAHCRAFRRSPSRRG